MHNIFSLAVRLCCYKSPEVHDLARLLIGSQLVVNELRYRWHTFLGLSPPIVPYVVILNAFTMETPLIRGIKLTELTTTQKGAMQAAIWKTCDFVDQG